MTLFVHYNDVKGRDWPWSHFTPREMADRDTGELVLVPAFMDWLERVRMAFDKPVVVNSGYRTPLHQFEISGRRTGAHPDGMAVDVKVCGEDAELLERIAIDEGVLGRGVQQCGKVAHERRYLHLDMWTKAPKGMRPRLWSY
ncbi:MAG: D-Ala-D-Ala carboxypeptidase family metallohydrolase [Geminicoccaceae bacterium]